MIKKLDFLIFSAFIGPFFLTTAVANFILLLVNMLKYFDDLMGKNLGLDVFIQLFFYFSLNTIQFSLPLGVLVASLMTFGNLGETFELTAIKSSGISLIRTLRPIFFFVILLSFGSFYFNDIIIPKANLKAYSLLYDIKHAKPALDIKEGVFYEGLSDFTIKVKKKYPDGRTLKGVMIYDHTNGIGNNTIILADSSQMYMFMDDKYLKLELYKGNYYVEQQSNNEAKIKQMTRSSFHKMDLVFSLESFNLKRRKEELFNHNRQMMDISKLTVEIDKFKKSIDDTKKDFVDKAANYFDFHLDKKKTALKEKYTPKIDSTKIETKTPKLEEASLFSALFQQQEIQELRIQDDEDINFNEDPETLELLEENDKIIKNKQDSSIFSKPLRQYSVKNYPLKSINLDSISIDSLTFALLDTILQRKNKNSSFLYENAIRKAKNIASTLKSTDESIYYYVRSKNLFTIERDKKYSQAIACFLMFLIGAPLGSIIKKGGLGTPTIVAIFFFILHYVFMIVGQQQAKEGVMTPQMAVWMADLILLPFGLFFLRQAWVDARLFELDFYNILLSKIKKKIGGKE